MNANRFLIINAEFRDWIKFFKNNNKIKYIDKEIDKEIDNLICNDNSFIMPITVKNYKRYNNYPNCIFKNNLNNIDILDNKSMFAEYMLKNFPENISEVYFYNYNDMTYINNPNDKIKMISKLNLASAGTGTQLIYDFNELKIKDIKNKIITKYTDHEKEYSGHLLIINGKIIKKIYFVMKCKINAITCGQITNYDILEKISYDVIFDKIFEDLQYSGFANIDFTIIDNKIIIFEINPRIGGSLVYNDKYFNIFLDTLIDNLII